MSEYSIKNVEEVLSEHIKKGKKLHDVKLTRLTEKGENFGSIMLKVDLVLEDEEDGKLEEKFAVTKLLPADEMIRKIFNVQVTFKNEIAMYNTILPLIQDFQRENGVTQVFDSFPEFYGGRINLQNENGVVDDDAILILENLNYRGYQVVDRFVGFDLETAQLIIKDLAAFHALPLALKLKKPNVFEKQIKPYLASFRPPSMPEQKEVKKVFIQILQDSYKCIPYIPKIKKIFENEKEARLAPAREPFATVVHGDMWVNNTMVKFQNGKPVHNKLVDFQVCDYKSSVTDLLFFLFSSVQLSVLQDDLDNLIELYYKLFNSHLEQLKCDTAPFSFHNYIEEIKVALGTEIPHTMMMTLFVVFGKKGGPSKDFDPTQPPNYDEMMKNLNLAAVEKVQYMIQICGKKGWLQ